MLLLFVNIQCSHTLIVSGKIAPMTQRLAQIHLQQHVSLQLVIVSILEPLFIFSSINKDYNGYAILFLGYYGNYYPECYLNELLISIFPPTLQCTQPNSGNVSSYISLFDYSKHSFSFKFDTHCPRVVFRYFFLSKDFPFGSV